MFYNILAKRSFRFTINEKNKCTNVQTIFFINEFQ